MIVQSMEYSFLSLQLLTQLQSHCFLQTGSATSRQPAADWQNPRYEWTATGRQEASSQSYTHTHSLFSKLMTLFNHNKPRTVSRSNEGGVSAHPAPPAAGCDRKNWSCSQEVVSSQLIRFNLLRTKIWLSEFDSSSYNKVLTVTDHRGEEFWKRRTG